MGKDDTAKRSVKAERFVDTSRLLATTGNEMDTSNSTRPESHSHTVTQSHSHTVTQSHRDERCGGLPYLRSRLADGCAVASSPRCNYSSSGDVRAAQQPANDKEKKRRWNVCQVVWLNDIDERGERITASLFCSSLCCSLTIYPRPRPYL